MATDYKRMQQRGGTEVALLEENQVPLPREVIVASDTGAFWVGTDAGDALSDLPKQGPIRVDPSGGTVSLPDGTELPTVDPGTQQLPDSMREAITANLADATTPEGAAVADAIRRAGVLVYDTTTGLYTVPTGSRWTYDSASGLYTTN